MRRWGLFSLSPATTVVNLLRKTSAPTAIEELRLTLGWEGAVSGAEDQLISQPEWDQLDALLTGPNYRALKGVTIIFKSQPDTDDRRFIRPTHTATRVAPRLPAFPRLGCREGINFEIAYK